MIDVNIPMANVEFNAGKSSCCPVWKSLCLEFQDKRNGYKLAYC